MSNVYLRALEYKDEEFLIKIREDKSLFQHTGGNTYFMSTEHSKKLLKENILNNGNQIYLIICLIENQKPIGYLSITDVDHLNKKVKWGGIVIEPQSSGHGYATEAAKLMLKFIFEELDINRVYGEWLEENVASLRMAEKLGFQKEGLMKQYVFKNNKYHNVYICSLLKAELYEKRDR